MKEKSKYILYREDAESYVLQKDFPHYIGRLTNKLERSLAQYPISGYSLYVSFAGTLRGNYISSDKFALDEMASIYADMANYILEKLIKSSDDYDKYKIRDTSK
jgi:hypothetical protein